MILKRHLLLLLFLLLTFKVIAQDFKVIKETERHIIKEVDSSYYYSHGIKPKNDFALDTTKIHKVNGILRLPLDNGKEVVFKDTFPNNKVDLLIFNCIGFDRSFKNYYVGIDSYYGKGTYLVNKINGTIDTIDAAPIYSPSRLFYAYSLFDWSDKGCYLVIKNIISNKKTEDKYFVMSIFHNIKWINDKSFVFYSDGIEMVNNDWKLAKYYLVQIKK